MLALAPTGAHTKQDKDAQMAEKISKAIAKLGTGEKARVRVKLKDKTKIQGYVSRIGADDLQITDAKAGTTMTVRPTIKRP